MKKTSTHYAGYRPDGNIPRTFFAPEERYIAKLLLTNSTLKGIMHNKVRVRFMGDYIPLPDRGVGPNTCRRDELKIVTFITGMDDGKNKKNI